MREYLPKLTYVINHGLGNGYLTLARVLFFFFFFLRRADCFVGGGGHYHA